MRGHAGRARGARRGRRGYLPGERGFRRRDIVAAQPLVAQPIAFATQAELVAAQDGVDREVGCNGSADS